MATQQNTRGDDGRIYASKPADVTYRGAARSIGFNPVKAANNEKAMRDYKAAVVADGQTMSRELTRIQQAENLALSAQQKSDKGQQGLNQLGESIDLKTEQTLDSANLKIDQTAAQQELKQSQTYDRGLLELEATHSRLSGQVAGARLKATSTAIQGLLSFAGSVVKYDQQMQDFQAQEEREKLVQQQNDALNGAFFGADFYNPTPEQQEETEAVGEVINSGLQAEATALGDAAREMRKESPGDPFVEYQAQQVESMSSWNSLADTRGNVFAARMQYPGFLAEARAAGLIRPGSQGMADIQALNRKFADATGITGAAMSNPEFVAQNFSRAAQGEAMNVLRSIATEAANEIQSAREAKVNSNIATNFAGLGPNATTADLGVAFNAANEENVNGSFAGRMSSTSTYSTAVKVTKELADSGRTADLVKLQRHVPNPSTPNLTLGKQFPDLFDKEILRSRQQARTTYNLGKAEFNQQAESIANNYWQNPTPENLRQAEAQLRSIPTTGARSLADRLVQHGYDYDPSVARDIASKRGTAEEYSVDQIKDLSSKGIINPNEAKLALSRAPDTLVSANIDEAIKLYQPGKSIIDNTVSENGRPITVNRPSAAFKQQLRIKEKRFNIELGKRLQAVLRDNKNLEVESQEFQDIVNKESEYLRDQERFKIHYQTGKGYYFGSDKMSETTEEYLEKITIAPGQQNLYGLSATDVFSTARLSKALIDPTEDQIMTPEEITADTASQLKGESVSKRTNDWAAALGMSQKDFINGQRYQMGLPPMDDVRTEIGVPVNTKDIKNQFEGMRELRSLGMPTRGAAYMSSAILHESTWHGTRQWGEVAGDGTNRNGGLLSWASWAGNSARLGQIERYFGRNIAQISEPEQLQFLMHELKSSYPESHAIFMDPNASSADLQWATWNYIRWDKQHTGTRWSTAESLIRWGNQNI